MFSRRDAPELYLVACPSGMRGRREDRVRAAPAVSCAMCTKKCAHEHTGPAESIRPSLRNGLTAYGALFPETNSSCLRRCRIDDRSNPVGFRSTSASLTPATGARTTRFCRTQQRRSSCADQSLTAPRQARDRPAMPRARNAIASTATRTPRIVTTRTPLFDEAGWREDGADLGEMRSGIFLPRNLDDPNRVEMAGEIRFCAQRVWDSLGGAP